MAGKPNQEIKPGDRVALSSTGEKGIVICSWDDEIGDTDCYIAFFGDSWPTSATKPDRPYILRYFASSLLTFSQYQQLTKTRFRCSEEDRRFIRQLFAIAQSAKPDSLRYKQSDQGLDALEDELGFFFPPLFRTFLTTDWHSKQFNRNSTARFKDNDDTWQQIHLPGMTGADSFSDLRSFNSIIDSIPRCGFQPFGRLCKDRSLVLCFDLERRQSDGDYPIVVIPNDRVSSVSNTLTRESLRPHVSEIAQNFRQLLQEIRLDSKFD